MNLAIIGVGNMGGAIAKSLLSHPKDDLELTLIDLDAEKLKLFRSSTIKKLEGIPNKGMEKFDVVLLAVKPQISHKVLDRLEGKLSDDCLLISVMAGVTTAKIKAESKHEKVIRTMPNLGLLVNEGIVGAYSNTPLTSKEKEAVNALFTFSGELYWLKKETELDAFTAIFGSGPAYVFYFMKAIKDKAISYGFSDKQAEQMTISIFKSAIKLNQLGSETLEQLISRVMSKGGTTEAALKSFDGAALNRIIKTGIEAAKKRSKELNA